MEPNNFKLNNGNSKDGARAEEDPLFAGIGEALTRAGELGLQLLELQQAVLRGVVRSQRIEAERLAAQGGKDDPRIAEAMARAERFDAVRADAEKGTKLGQQLVSTFQEDGVFQGYVMQADGAAAESYTVQLKLVVPNQRAPISGTAKTDATGYFRMKLDLQKKGLQKDIGSWAERVAAVAGVAPVRQAQSTAAPQSTTGPTSAPGPTPTPGPTPMPGQSRDEASVQVLDPTGRTVFSDPVPPAFESGMSEFRYYVLS
jgi:hypothetical protein